MLSIRLARQKRNHNQAALGTLFWRRLRGAEHKRRGRGSRALCRSQHAQHVVSVSEGEMKLGGHSWPSWRLTRKQLSLARILA